MSPTTDDLLDQLPEAIREALDKGGLELQDALRALSEEERIRVRKLLMQIQNAKREDLLKQLPDDLRVALTTGDGAKVQAARAKLSDEAKVKAVFEKLARLPMLVSPEEEAEINREALEELEHVKITTPAFGPPAEAEVAPSPEDLKGGHRGDEGFLYPVWYATTRKPRHSNDPTRGFTGAREVPGTVHYGVARVYVPKAHKFGELGSSTWWGRWVLRRDDDRLALRQIEVRMELDDYLAEIKAFLEKFKAVNYNKEGQAPKEGEVLLFVHGFNCSFADAMIRAAQLGCDLRVPGLTACFSWASSGEVTAYNVDEATVEAQAPALLAFIKELVKKVGNGRVHLLAHSMGNRATLYAVERLVDQAQKDGFRLGQILLAAPDVDRDTFQFTATAYKKLTDLQATLYTSNKDRAVGTSRWLHRYPRAGYSPPVTTVVDTTTIDVTGVDLSTLGHAYYGNAHAVLYDMADLLHHNTLPGQRTRLVKEPGEKTYYHFQS